VNLYEEGIRISKECAEKLKLTELKIKKLSKGIEGQFTLNESDEE
jgi:exonuclease VII small subunit